MCLARDLSFSGSWSTTEVVDMALNWVLLFVWRVVSHSWDSGVRTEVVDMALNWVLLFVWRVVSLGVRTEVIDMALNCPCSAIRLARGLSFSGSQRTDGNRQDADKPRDETSGRVFMTLLS
jgi:hypothetical protein